MIWSGKSLIFVHFGYVPQKRKQKLCVGKTSTKTNVGDHTKIEIFQDTSKMYSIWSQIALIATFRGCQKYNLLELVRWDIPVHRSEQNRDVVLRADKFKNKPNQSSELLMLVRPAGSTEMSYGRVTFAFLRILLIFQYFFDQQTFWRCSFSHKK